MVSFELGKEIEMNVFSNEKTRNRGILFICSVILHQIS